ncbi:MAG: GtrA family protein [Bacteroidia bacterium]|nr:GtrA family protein [Bacteroidia bacterium]HRG03921.1 GtrA family protein [Paludibacteraceae bacterium]
MRKVFILTGKFISDIIDFFYPPFRRYFSLQFFRYGVSGAGNMVFDWLLYSFVYNVVLQKQMLNLGLVTLSSPIAALFITFPITLFTGFLLQKYVTFTASEMRGHKQLVRYMLVVALNLVINYTGLKILNGVLGLWPLASKMIITVITTLFSYFSQKKFTFRIKNAPDKK